MTVNHKDLTTTALHEPKGVAAASANTVYGANGSGSGTWAKVDAANIDTASIKNSNLIAITYNFINISTASSQWVAVPLAGDIQKIYSVLQAANGSGNAVFTFEIATVAVTTTALTIAASGAAGDLDSTTPSGANTLTAGQAIEIICDGGSTNAVNAAITFLLDVA